MKNLYKDGEAIQKLKIVIKVTRLVRVSEAARLLNMNENDFQTLINNQEIQFIGINGQTYFDENDLSDWMFKQNVPMIKNSNPSLNNFAN